MQSADVVDFSTERRVTASLSCTLEVAELVVMNGGSRAEELTVETIVTGKVPRLRKAIYSLDAGTSVALIFPLLSRERVRDLVVTVAGGPAPIVLTPSASLRSGEIARRSGGVVAAAVMLVALAGGQLGTGVPPYTAEALPPAPEPVAIRTAAFPSRVQGPLPAVVTIARASGDRMPVIRRVAEHLAAPRFAAFTVPAIVHGSAAVHVRYAADAASVHIVASIGPTIVAERTVRASGGTYSFHPPRSSRDGRVMTVRAYAKRGARTQVASALVVLERD